MKKEIEGRAGRAYSRAVEAVLAIPIGIGIGYFVDGRLGSKPIGLLIGAAFGFAAFVRRLVSMRSLVEGEAADAAESSKPERRDS